MPERVAKAALSALLPVALLALLAAGCDPGAPADAVPPGEAGADKTDRPAGDPDEAPADPERKAPEPYVAVIVPRESVDVSPKVPGEVVQIHVEVGDRVKAGDLLATLDNGPARDELAVATAELSSARALLGESQVAVDEGRNTLKRVRELVDKGLAPAKDKEEAEFAVKRALASRNRARAAVGEQRARISGLKRALGETQLRARFEGTIAAALSSTGAIVRPGVPVVRLIDDTSLKVRFAVPPDDVGSFRAGDSVVIDIDTIEQPIAGVVREIAPQIDGASNRIFVDAELSIPDAARSAIRAGMAATVRADSGQE